jgi:hypothetical protein
VARVASGHWPSRSACGACTLEELAVAHLQRQLFQGVMRSDCPPRHPAGRPRINQKCWKSGTAVLRMAEARTSGLACGARDLRGVPTRHSTLRQTHAAGGCRARGQRLAARAWFGFGSWEQGPSKQPEQPELPASDRVTMVRPDYRRLRSRCFSLVVADAILL